MEESKDKNVFDGFSDKEVELNERPARALLSCLSCTDRIPVPERSDAAPETAKPGACPASHAVLLPDSILGDIAMRMRLRGTLQTPVLYLMTMHSTCTAWRRVTKALPKDAHLLFDGASYVNSSFSTLEQRFKGKPVSERRQFLHLAAQRCAGNPPWEQVTPGIAARGSDACCRCCDFECGPGISVSAVVVAAVTAPLLHLVIALMVLGSGLSVRAEL